MNETKRSSLWRLRKPYDERGKEKKTKERKGRKRKKKKRKEKRDRKELFVELCFL